MIVFLEGINDAVDGRNPAPVDMVKIPLFTGFYTSQVVQDFFHQQFCWLKRLRHDMIVIPLRFFDMPNALFLEILAWFTQALTSGSADLRLFC